MKSLRWTIPLLAAIALAAVACSGPGAGSKADPAVGRDYARYKAQMVAILPLESQAIDANAQATGAPGANDATYAKALRATVIPAFRAFWGELIRMQPLTEPVLELHRLYLRRTALVISGFEDLEKAGRTGSRAFIESSRAKGTEGKALFDFWNKEMEEMNKEYKGEATP